MAGYDYLGPSEAEEREDGFLETNFEETFFLKLFRLRTIATPDANLAFS